MVELTLKIDGMMCPMCESHINDAIRCHFPVKKVRSSCKTGETVILAKEEPDLAVLKALLAGSGYPVISARLNPDYHRPSGLRALFRRG